MKFLNETGLRSRLGERVRSVEAFGGQFAAEIDASSWIDAARALREGVPAYDHFIDLTAVDYPEAEPQRRFEVVLLLRASATGERVRIKTRCPADGPLPSLTSLWRGANWAERELFDLFGVRFSGHPDLRRILLYEPFEGHPLRKDYPIERTQPIVEYREVAGVTKLAPFGAEEGQPFGRVDWAARLAGRDLQVSPSIALQSQQRRALSESTSGCASRAVHKPVSLDPEGQESEVSKPVAEGSGYGSR